MVSFTFYQQSQINVTGFVDLILTRWRICTVSSSHMSYYRGVDHPSIHRKYSGLHHATLKKDLIASKVIITWLYNPFYRHYYHISFVCICFNPCCKAGRKSPFFPEFLNLAKGWKHLWAFLEQVPISPNLWFYQFQYLA